MKQYESYKPSGTPWIGDIPSHWEVMKIAHLYNFIGSGTTPATGVKEYYDEGGINWLQTGDLSDGAIYGTSKHISLLAKKELNLKLYPEGSLVVAMYGATVGKLGLLNVPTTVNQACCVLVNSKRLYNKFSFYSFLAAKKSLIVLSTGGGQPNISQDIIRNHHTIVPPIDEQVAIADYLDRKCESIDKVIATQERRIELLTELKQSIITEAVTRGINPDVPLKDSGIDWIGKIPEHWEVMPFKRCMTINNGADYKDIETDENNGHPVIGSGGIFAYALNYMYEGEALLLGRKGTIDRPMYFNGKFWTVDTMFFAIPLKNIDCKYMYYQSLGFPYDLYSTATALPSMTSRDLNSNPVCIPPFEEQQIIVIEIENRIRPIDSAISKAKREIELLREFKQSVITEAVTGKIKVC